MPPDSSLLALIGQIYDAALDDRLWEPTLERIAAYTDTVGVALGTQRTTGEPGSIVVTGVDPSYVRSYIETWHFQDPMLAVRFREIGKACSTRDYLPVDEFRARAFFQEWVRPQGMFGGANVLLARSSSEFTALGVSRGTMIDAALLAKLSQIAPHLSRALRINGAMEGQAARAGAFTQVLEKLKAGVFLLNANGYVVHLNESARDILDRGDLLRQVHGRLVANTPCGSRILRQSTVDAGIDGDTVASAPPALPLIASNGERYAGYFVPLTGGARRESGHMLKSTVALFVCKAALEVHQAPEIVKDIFKLTPAELRVLLAIVEVGSVPEAARKLAIADSTVKTHLSSVFVKTDTRRQADLVKLMAAFSSPARH